MKPYILKMERNREYERNAVARTGGDLFAVGKSLTIANIDKVGIVTTLDDG
jgi:hypothetical protein